MKLWVKIVLLNVTIVICLGLLVGIAVRRAVTDSMREELSKWGESLAKNLSNVIADPMLIDDIYKIDEIISDAIKTEKDLEYIFVTSKEGQLLAHTFNNGYPPDLLSWNPLNNKQISMQLLDTEIGFIRDVGIKVFEGMEPELHIGIKEQKITQTIEKIRNLIIFLTVITLVIGSLLSCVLTRFITKPLNRLVDFTHDLAKGNFGSQIEIKSKDEVGDLSLTFNHLSQELKAYKEKMEQSYKQMLMTEKLTALGRLSAGLAHEIKNPLTSIKVLFQALRHNPSLTQEDIDVVLSATEQIDDLVTRFLRFARIDKFEVSDVYINAVIKHVIKLTRLQLKLRSIDLSLKLTKIPAIKADRSMIQQAILSLIINAIEAMPQGGTLTISSKREGSFVTIQIEDTGKGIPEEIRDNVFDPFFTTKDEGTGLGLSIVYNIINLHNGKVTFKTDHSGTTFIINLPLNV